MASIFGAAAQQEIKDQPWYLRYKGSLLIVGSGIAWILGELSTSQEIADLGWSSAVGIVATLVAFLVNRFTRDGITPSMANRLEQAGQKAFLDRPSVSAPLVNNAVQDPELPVYGGPSTNGK
ncbi:hypothetical protein [Corynebacterium glutamicum]|uniref:hypothetical protein n=1 Tax=Corynebacterium glutamicum TaxID=1718 RepID=UPI001B8D2FDB|nr:hypothetical protein [Corynebacterium glutamicum]